MVLLADTRGEIDRPDGSRPGAITRICKWLAGCAAQILAGDEEEVDPTASFSPRDWADLPTHHPASEE